MVFIGNLGDSEQIPPFLRGVYLIYNRYDGRVYLNHSDSIYYKMKAFRQVARNRVGNTRIERDIQFLGERWFDVHLVEAFEEEILSPIQKDEKVDYWVGVFQAYNPEKGYNAGQLQEIAI